MASKECAYHDCEGSPYVGPVCKDHFESFQRSGFPGDVKAWLESEAPRDDDTDETENKGTCAHGDCGKVCGADEFCHGCRHHVCEEHSVNFNMPLGSHSLETHFEEDFEDEIWKSVV